MPWAALLAFVRIASNPRFFERPQTIRQAWLQVEDWLSLESVWIPQPTERHREVLSGLIEQVDSDPNQVPDAHLAALAIEHQLTLYSSDRDFARFAGLSWVNPLAR